MSESKEKIRVLFRGWFEIPHSYSLCNCFQIVHLYKRYSGDIEFYVEEMPYFRQEWNNSKKLVYSEEYNNIIRNFKKWNGERVDLVYSITYPYDMNMLSSYDISQDIPKCVFYTSEFATLEPHYFSCEKDLSTDDSITKYIKDNPKLYMTSPSVWSSLGMKKYGLSDERNRIITHGVDTDVFKYDNSNRRSIRDFYKVKDNDILMINIGSMTKNKGMLYILQCLNVLVNKCGKKNFKLLLKGTGDLYQSKAFLEIYFEELQRSNVMTKDEMKFLLENNLIFTDKTLSYSKINDLFNAADLYLSPYLAEGFNLTSLEALSAGLPVMISETGSTKEYMNDIYTNGGKDHIIYIESDVIELTNGYKQNNIDFERLLNLILTSESRIYSLSQLRNNGGVVSYNKMKDYIIKEYSWNRVAGLLYDYFKYILK
jgi:glycosyltransferase involved in cell wall biosynthesis